MQLASGEFIPAELVVWAAGIRSFVCLQNMDNLEINGINQLLVKPTLQTTLDDNVFAIGDCAAAPWLGKAAGTLVPPRAQAAHQQAMHITKQIHHRLDGKPLQDFQYTDFGSLISLGEHSAAGGLMGNLAKGTLFVEGYIARFMYNMLYKKHQLGLHGFWKVVLDTVSGFMRRRTTPRIKLH